MDEEIATYTVIGAQASMTADGRKAMVFRFAENVEPLAFYLTPEVLDRLSEMIVRLKSAGGQSGSA